MPHVLVSDPANGKQFFRYPDGSTQAATQSDYLFFLLHRRIDGLEEAIACLKPPSIKLEPVQVIASEEQVEISPEALVNVNTASAEALKKIDGIGDATADEIIKGRPWETIDDLKKSKISAFKGVSANSILPKLKV